MRKITFINKLQAIVFTGVMAALLAVLSQISLPMPTGVPVTLQTFAVALCGYLLGRKFGTLSVAVFLALGAVGLPVFAGFSGGFGDFLGMTGGFLWGFLPFAFFCGMGNKGKNRIVAVLWGMGGLALCHVFGTAQYALLTSTGAFASFLLVSAPYLVKDVISVVGAYLVAEAALYSLGKAKLVTVE